MIILCHYVTSRRILSNTSTYACRFSPINKMMIDGEMISVKFLELRNLFKDIETRYYMFFLRRLNIEVSFYSRYVIFTTSTKYHRLFTVTSNVCET